MHARFLRYATLEELRNQIEANLHAYRSGDFKHIEVDGAWWFEHPVSIDQAKLGSLLLPSGQDLHEPENCQKTYEALKDLSPYEARDERLWAYLTHTTLLDYTRERWPIPSGDEAAVSHIAKHFFAKDKRQIERDNAASRLWWMAHLCARVEGLTMPDALAAFLYRSDVRANIIERPTSSQSTPLFSSILRFLSQSLGGERSLFERATFRRFMRELNSVGGFRLLDCLDPDEVHSIVADIVHQRLGLTIV